MPVLIGQVEIVAIGVEIVGVIMAVGHDQHRMVGW